MPLCEIITEKGAAETVTKQEYEIIASSCNKSSKSLMNIPAAFLSGGAICVAGQLLFALLSLCFDEKVSRTWVSVILIFLAALLTGTGIFDRIAKHTGAGTIVPITGFANAVAAAAMEFKSEGIVLGLSVKMFTIAGPVIVFGTVGSMVVGAVWYVIGLFGGA